MKIFTQTNLSEMGLNGNIKSINETSYRAWLKNGILTKIRKQRLFNTNDNYEIVFSRDGIISKKTLYFSNGKKSKEWFYYENGSVLKEIHSTGYKDKKQEIITVYNRRGDIKYKRFLDYDITKHKYITDSKINQNWKYVYDDNNQKMEERVLNNVGRPIFGVKKFKYDTNGNLTETDEIYSKTFSYRKFTFKYDKNNNVTEEKEHSQDKVVHKKLFKFNKAGDLLVKEEFNEDSVIESKEIHVYNENGKILESDYYFPDTIDCYNIIFEYDKNDYLIKKTIHNTYQKTKRKKVIKLYRDGKIIEEKEYYTGLGVKSLTYKYENDSNENWVKQIIYINDIPKFIIEREIEYFN